jgi:small conductance mechanosensitive channel
VRRYIRLKGEEGLEMVAHYIDLLVAYGTKITAALAILIAGAIFARLANRIIKESFIRAKVDVTIGKFLRRGVKYAIYAFAIITALSTLGMNIQPIIAGLGIAGFIIGFAVKGTISNFAAGMLLLFYRPFRVGDEISAAKVRGTVKEINIIATILETQEGDMITVPNSKVWGAPITKYSAKSSS